MSRAAGSGCLTAALLVLLARATGAGIVAADFNAGPYGSWRFSLRGSGRVLQLLLLPALTPFDPLGLLFRAGGLHQEQEPDRLCIDPVHHVLEQREGFLLELHQRIALPVATEPDAFLEVVEREQVIFPLAVDDVEDDVALEPAHRLGAELLFLFLVAPADQLEQARQQRVVAQALEIGLL